MNAFDIFSAVGGVGEDILEESEIMPNKKITKIIPMIAAAACFAVFAAGISHALRIGGIEQPVTDISETSPGIGDPVTESEPPINWSETTTYDVTHQTPHITEIETDPNASAASTVTEPYPAVTNYDIMPDPFGSKAEGTGGDENDGFYLPCNHILNGIPGSLLDLRDSDEVRKWTEKSKLSSKSDVISSIKDYENVYTFITDFNITREEAEAALEYYLKGNYITYEHLDIIFSGDIELITKTFASDLSIAVGDRIYSPEWLYMHSPDEYSAAGITPEDILSRVDLYRYILFTDEARQAFSEKLSEYTGETVVIGKITYEEKDDVIREEEAELVEDTYDDYVLEVPEEEVPEEYE